MKSNNKFIKKYIKEMTSIMMDMNPEWDKEFIEDTIKKMIKKNGQNPIVTLDNNYTGESRETSLLSVLDWLMERKPIIAGNGTFYKNQNEAINPIARMLKNFLIQRKAYKAEMFKVDDTSSPEYRDFDLKQQNEKVNANSYYGASGAPSSAFYSLWSGAATTLSAQSVISTTETLFESFAADNYYFLNMTELFDWMTKILKEFDDDLDDFIQIRSFNDTLDRLLSKVLDKQDNDEEVLSTYLDSLTDGQLTYLYYKNNLLEFIGDHEEVQDLIISIFDNIENLDYVSENDTNWFIKIPKKYKPDFVGSSSKEWNSFVNQQYFMDSNNVPESIANDLFILKNHLMKYVYSRYLSMDRIYRLKNFKRKVVTVIDTDSNILSLDTSVEYIMENVIKGSTFGRPNINNEFICVNMITNILTEAVTDILLTYGEYSNIPEDYRPIYNMKNEFFFSKLIIGETKKRYISKILLREGNMMNPPKYDIKGFDFKKATCSEFAEEFFMGLIKKYIIDVDTIDVRPILQEIKNFRTNIKESIERGERTYLPNMSAKELGAYKQPESEQSVRGVLAWNMLYPDNMIELPSKVSVVKLNIFKENDIEDLREREPEIYQTIIDKIFNDESGIFVQKVWVNESVDYVNPNNPDWYKKIPKKYQAKYKKLGPNAWNEFVDNCDVDDPSINPKGGHFDFKIRGMQVLAIPSNATIPEWVQPYIDYDTMINNILAPFNPVLEIFKNKTIDEGKTINGVNRKTAAFTNIIKF